VKAAIRVDASTAIGSGHVMRCLSLAQKLRRHGGDVRFLCRDRPGHLAPLIGACGFPVTLLSPPDTGSAPAPWLAVPWDADAAETLTAIEPEHLGASGPDWVVVDHYGVDARWERSIRKRAAHVLVLDDLADRPHDCDVLIDASYLPNLQNRYEGKVSPSCRTLLGPDYVLLREEFYHVRPGAKERILVSFGGYDVANQTLRVARVLARLSARRQPVDFVVGRAAPEGEALAILCDRTPGFTLRVQVSNMAELMSGAVLCIGGGGITTLERLFLRVPTIALAATEHEAEALRALGDGGYLRYLGSGGVVSDDHLAATISSQLTHPEVFRTMRFPSDDSWLWRELQGVSPASEARESR